MPEDFEFPADYWCILLNDAGDIIWSKNQPTDIPAKYTIRDIAKLTRWFLQDYPVYVRAEDYGLLILGIPKNAVGKYDMAYSMEWFDALPQRLLGILVLNLLLALLLAISLGFRFYRKLKKLTAGIENLRNEKPVKLPEKGIFKELSQNINEASNALERKNAILNTRDRARFNWIHGISHDIRTPLAVIMGNAEVLESAEELSTENKNRASTIITQSLKVKKMVEDLNISSSLEYDMQPAKKKEIRLCPLIRSIVSDCMNEAPTEPFQIHCDLQYEKAVVLGDESLLERAILNLLHNSMQHNPAGCTIHVKEFKEENNICLHIWDNGTGVPGEILQKLSVIPETAHGLGLPLAYKIIVVHGGSFEGYNSNGFHVKIKLPIAKS